MNVESLNFAVVAEALTEDPRQAPHLARQAGFAGIQFHAFSPSLNLSALSDTGRREFRHLLSAQSQQLPSLRVDIGPKGLGPGCDIDRVLARLDTTMQAAAAIGTRLICVDLNALPATDDANLAGQVDAAFIELGKHADRFGVIAAFRSDLASFAALERALKAANCPWFGIDLDPVAILRDDWPMDEIFSRLGPQIRHVRARDALAGTDRRTKPTVIGQGNVNWPELFSNLEHAGYHGWITVDSLELADRVTAATTGLEHLQKIISHG
jgi:sugar phosphate isomerase/epimerase